MSLLHRFRFARSRWAIAIAAFVIGSLIALVLVSGSYVQRAVEQRAAERGVELSMRSARLRFGQVVLDGVVARLRDVPSVRVELDRVTVGVSPWLTIREIASTGGAVAVDGELDQVQEQLRRFRARSVSGSGHADGGSVTPIRIDGLHVVWRSGSAGTQYFWGASYHRDAQRNEAAAVDLARVKVPGLAVEARDVSIEMAPQGAARVLERVSVESVNAEIDLDASGSDAHSRPGMGSQAGATIPIGGLGHRGQTPAGGAEPAVDKGAAPRHPWAKRGVVLARAPAAAATASRAAALGQALSKVRAFGSTALRPGAAVGLGGLRLRLRHGQEKLDIGPSSLRVERTEGHLQVGLVPGERVEAGKTPLAVRLRIPLTPDDVELELEGGPVSLSSLGVVEGDFGLTNVSSASIRARGKAVLAADNQSLRVDGDALLGGLSIQHDALSKQAVHDIALGVRGKAELALDGSRLNVEDAEVQIGRIQLKASALVELGDGWAVAKGKLAMPLSSCQEAVESIPKGLMPLLEGIEMTGTVSLDSAVEFDTRKLSNIVVKWDLANACRITKIPGAVSPSRFRQAWVREVLGSDGQPIEIESGRDTRDWVPYEFISPHMETAVLVCEDGRFFRHKGYDKEAIRNSIRDNIMRGRFFRGASTITMQLAKNLYLKREKTLARKLQEALLTVLLEQELSKEEIMELYLNVIEFGPGIYGVGPAAAHYFDTVPGRLSLAQALYLGSILPNPKRSYFAEDGRLKDHWHKYLQRLMQLAHNRKRISDSELEQGLRERIVRGQPAPDMDSEPAAKPEALDPDEPIAPSDDVPL